MSIMNISIVVVEMTMKSMIAAAAATITGMTMTTIMGMTIVMATSLAAGIAAAVMIMNLPAPGILPSCLQACRSGSIFLIILAAPTVPQRWSGRSGNFRE